jgi:hypothetical protein
VPDVLPIAGRIPHPAVDRRVIAAHRDPRPPQHVPAVDLALRRATAARVLDLVRERAWQVGLALTDVGAGASSSPSHAHGVAGCARHRGRGSEATRRTEWLEPLAPAAPSAPVESIPQKRIEAISTQGIADIREPSSRRTRTAPHDRLMQAVEERVCDQPVSRALVGWLLTTVGVLSGAASPKPTTSPCCGPVSRCPVPRRGDGRDLTRPSGHRQLPLAALQRRAAVADTSRGAWSTRSHRRRGCPSGTLRQAPGGSPHPSASGPAVVVSRQVETGSLHWRGATASDTESIQARGSPRQSCD